MKSFHITVLSNKPAGGRCKLYANYAKTLGNLPGFTMETIYPNDSHQLDAPGLLINGQSIIPNDGVIIDGADICKAIEQAGFELTELQHVKSQLDTLIEELLRNT